MRKYCDCGKRATMHATFIDMTDDTTLFVEEEADICRGKLIEWAYVIQVGKLLVTRLEALK